MNLFFRPSANLRRATSKPTLYSRYFVLLAVQALAALGCTQATADSLSDNQQLGSIIHQSRKFVIFTGQNKGDLDVQCTMAVQVTYADANGTFVGFRDVPRTFVIPAHELAFTEEVGRDIIQGYEQQYPGAVIKDVRELQKRCEDKFTTTVGPYTYRGSYVGGVREGEFEETGPNGYRFKGTIRGGRENGNGREDYGNGNWYVGQFKDGNREGIGTYTWSNGNTYVGSWVDGKREGRGKLTLESSGQTYEGQFKNDTYDGPAIYRWRDGTWEETHYEDGIENGFAIWHGLNEYVKKGHKTKGQWDRGGYSQRPNKGGSNATIHACNNTREDIYFAYSRHQFSEWRTRGWFKIPGSTCTDIAFERDQGWSVYGYAHRNQHRTWWATQDSRTDVCIDRIDRFDDITDKFCSEHFHPDFIMASFGTLSMSGGIYMFRAD
jgi:hypothetical protein